MKMTCIKLPVQYNPNGNIFIDNTHQFSDEGFVPDWQFMEDYIRSLHYKPLTTNHRPNQVPALNVQQWKEFRLEKIFDIKPTKGVISENLLEGNEIPYIGTKYDTNGLMMMCQRNGFEDWVSEGNCIVFIMLGEGSAGYVNYMGEDFIGMNGKTACGYNPRMNKYSGLFIATILCQERPKYSFGRSWTGDRLRNTIIKLPSTESDEPDWQFMEDYIKALPYGDRL